jgi:hypothetical protein
MADSEHEDDDGSDVSPLNVSDLKLRLLHADPSQFSPHAQVVKEITALGAAGAPLLPIVVEQYCADKLRGVAVSALVKLYVQSRYPDLLNALREKGALHSLGVFEQCTLLEAGVSELEPKLLASLWEVWDKADKPARAAVVKALGKAGSSKALEMLEVIRYRMAGQVQEANAVLGGSPAQDEADMEPILKGMEANAHETFLGNVRDAIVRIKERGTG